MQPVFRAVVDSHERGMCPIQPRSQLLIHSREGSFERHDIADLRCTGCHLCAGLSVRSSGHIVFGSFGAGVFRVAMVDAGVLGACGGHRVSGAGLHANATALRADRSGMEQAG